MGYLTAVFVLLFVFSAMGYRKTSDQRALFLCVIMGFFAVKNIALTILYLGDDIPSLSRIMFADVPVVVGTLIAMARY